MSDLPYTDLQKGTLLLSTLDVLNPAYFQAVVLLVAHNDEGSFGLIVNKPLLEIPILEDLDIESLPEEGASFYQAGPYDEKKLLIGASIPLSQESIPINEHLYIGAQLEDVQDALHRKESPEFFFCLGYCFWDAGELEREFMDNSWLLHPPIDTNPFKLPPHNLWQKLLRSLGSQGKLLSMVPPDLSLN